MLESSVKGLNSPLEASDLTLSVKSLLSYKTSVSKGGNTVLDSISKGT